MFGQFLNATLKSISMSVFFCIITYFSYLDPHETSERDFFAEMASEFQSLAIFVEKFPSEMFDNFLNVFVNAKVMLLYYQYSFSLIYLVIL